MGAHSPCTVEDARRRRIVDEVLRACFFTLNDAEIASPRDAFDFRRTLTGIFLMMREFRDA